jgi:nucleotide-binding universal stress UspA family protein
MSPMSLSTIVVGFDGSPASERAARRAAEVVDDGGRIVIVTASPPLMSDGLAQEPLDGPSPEERDEILARGKNLLLELGIDAHVMASDDKPARALAQAATTEAADLIIVGATGTGYVARAILGSTSTAILRSAPCDVLVVQ